MFELMQSGRAADEAAAERLYAELAPLIAFLMQSIGQFLCYGKRLTARRLGLGEVHDRAAGPGADRLRPRLPRPPRRGAGPAALNW